MEKYCTTLDIRYIDKQHKYIKDEIKRVLDEEVIIDKIPKDRKVIYYILHSYFYPSKIQYDYKFKLNTLNFCQYYSTYKLTPQKIKSLFFTVYNEIVLKGLDPNLTNLSVEYLGYLFKIVDKLYFNDLINKHLDETHSSLNFIFNNNDKIAGVCSKNGCKYFISMNTSLFQKYFDTLKAQRSGGIQCRNPLSCMIITFLHELTHLIIYAFCPIYKSEHPKIFKDISRSLFGHTEYTHSLGVDSNFIGLSKDILKNRKYISFTYNNCKYTGKINKINRTRVSVTIINGNDIIKKGELLRVPFYIIDKEEPIIEDKDTQSINSKIGLTKDELKSRTYISFTDSNNNITGKINKINRTRVIVTIINGNDKYKKGQIVVVPFSIINKE